MLIINSNFTERMLLVSQFIQAFFTAIRMWVAEDLKLQAYNVRHYILNLNQQLQMTKSQRQAK